jgi:bile acid-coenzyme A ligase
MYHSGPFGLSMYGLCVGNHVVLFPRFDAECTLSAVAEHRGTFMFVVPTMMLRMSRLGEDVRARHDLSSLEVLWHFAAPCPEWLKADWIDWLGGERVWELYGGTEMQAMTVIRGDEWLEHRGSVGRCLIGEMKVVDPDSGADLPAGAAGEIYLRRDAEGTPSYHYLGSDARTLPGHWESLGDIGMIDADGYVYLGDRRSDMILVGGENVYPAEVEGALMEHTHVLSAAVIGLPDEELGNRIHAIVQVTADVDDDELAAFLAERLVRYKLPRSFEYTAEPVRDDAGKVRRSALRADRLRRVP